MVTGESHHTSVSKVAGVTEKERELMLKSVSVLGECVSACERIYNTPIPLAYSRHTSRFLVIYTSSLPLALVHSIGWITLPVVAMIVWALFGILEIGNLIEEPFSAVVDFSKLPLLPLTEVCRTIRRDVREIATFEQHARSHGVPLIQRVPKVRELPESFSELRELITSPNATNWSSSGATTSDNDSSSMIEILVDKSIDKLSGVFGLG